MKKLLFALILVSVVCQGPEAWAQRQLVDRVIAVVNDEAITQSELDIMMRPIYEEMRKHYTGEKLMVALNDTRRKLMNQLIEDRLVLQEAQSQGIEISDLEIEESLGEFKSRFPDEATMEQALIQEGMTIGEIRDRIRRQAMVRRLHQIEIRSKVLVSPIEVQKYYFDNPQEFSGDESVRTRSITIKKNDEARQKGLKDEDAHHKVFSIRQKILGGADFEKLAREMSEDLHAEKGGLSDWIEPGTMIEAINDVIFKMQPGEISAIIETPMGYHLFRLEERREGYKKTLDEVRAMIQSKIYQDKSEMRFRNWMQDLKRSAYISIR